MTHTNLVGSLAPRFRPHGRGPASWGPVPDLTSVLEQEGDSRDFGAIPEGWPWSVMPVILRHKGEAPSPEREWEKRNACRENSWIQLDLKPA